MLYKETENVPAFLEKVEDKAILIEIRLQVFGADAVESIINPVRGTVTEKNEGVIPVAAKLLGYDG